MKQIFIINNTHNKEISRIYFFFTIYRTHKSFVLLKLEYFCAYESVAKINDAILQISIPKHTKQVC